MGTFKQSWLILLIFCVQTRAADERETTWSVHFIDKTLNVSVTQLKPVTYIFEDREWSATKQFDLCMLPLDDKMLHIDYCIPSSILVSGQFAGQFVVEGRKMGHTKIYAELRTAEMKVERSTQDLDAFISRPMRTGDALFQTAIGLFVIIMYIGFGAALDLHTLKEILVRPVGPCIGMLGQFVIMPLLSYAIGLMIFPDSPELRLGLFFTGTTPGGGSSNIFTVILNGNINLSITMTTVSNLFAFIAMPAWIFTLGAVIFRQGNFVIPYAKIAIMSMSLMLPLAAGLALKTWAPQSSKRIIKLLKPISIVLIIAITIAGFTVNGYIFAMFTYKTLIATAALPWLGYIISWCLAKIMRQSSKDALTIAIETGIQNIGIAIFMLYVTLPQPQADMTSAVPMANSMMTPLPLLLLYFMQKCFNIKIVDDDETGLNEEEKDQELAAMMKAKDNTIATIEKGESKPLN